jgi:transcription termination factor Rho
MFIQMISAPPQGAGMDNSVATEAIITRMERAKNNIEFLENLTRDASFVNSGLFDSRVN